MSKLWLSIPTFALLAGCSQAATSTAPDGDEEAVSTGEAELRASPGRVYALTNELDNAVLVFDRAEDGSLAMRDRVTTGGRGSDDGLGSQGSLTLSRDGRWLFAVNAGSSEISTFRVRRDGLELSDVTSSGGDRPISVTEAFGRVFVLNAGTQRGQGIKGFYIADAHLHALRGGARSLSAATDVGPAEIAFSPSADALVVTEKATSRIDTFPMAWNGTPGAPIVTASAGDTPFGFDFDRRGALIVSDAFGGAAGAGASSSYHVDLRAGAKVVTGPVGSGQAAPCWLLTTNDDHAFVANTASGTVSAYAIGHHGSLKLLDGGVTATTGSGTRPADMALTRGDRFLYVRGGDGSLTGFRVGDGAALTKIDAVTGLPAHTSGIAAR